jgi:hypothetical protein
VLRWREVRLEGWERERIGTSVPPPTFREIGSILRSGQARFKRKVLTGCSRVGGQAVDYTHSPIELALAKEDRVRPVSGRFGRENIQGLARPPHLGELVEGEV